VSPSPSRPPIQPEVRHYGTIGGTLDDMDRLLKKLAQEGVERLCYEAGPTGYPLCRHLRQRGHVCEVIAPSLIPKKHGDRVKTNRRDSDQIARLFRAGELTGIYVFVCGSSLVIMRRSKASHRPFANAQEAIKVTSPTLRSQVRS
jgi:transposase